MVSVKRFATYTYNADTVKQSGRLYRVSWPWLWYGTRLQKRCIGIEQPAQSSDVGVVGFAGVVEIAVEPLARSGSAKLPAKDRHIIIADNAVKVGVGTAR